MIEAQEGDGTLWPARVISHSCEYDLAMLGTEADLYPVLGIRTFDDLRKGETVYAVGAPRGMVGTITTGSVANLLRHQNYRPQMPDVNLVISTAAITPGNSGGGLFDQYGNLVGLNEAILQEYQSLFVAIPITELVRKQ